MSKTVHFQATNFWILAIDFLKKCENRKTQFSCFLQKSITRCQKLVATKWTIFDHFVGIQPPLSIFYITHLCTPTFSSKKK